VNSPFIILKVSEHCHHDAGTVTIYINSLQYL